MTGLKYSHGRHKLELLVVYQSVMNPPAFDSSTCLQSFCYLVSHKPCLLHSLLPSLSRSLGTSAKRGLWEGEKQSGASRSLSSDPLERSADQFQLIILSCHE